MSSMTSVTRPVDFVYIGAPRCGSTWLSAILTDHPQIYIPPSKEIHYFNDRMPYRFEYRYPMGIDYYKSFFSGARDDQLRGDISPFYYADPNAAWRIKEKAPEVKILCFLREPVAMLHSLYLLLRQREHRAESFERELDRSPQLIDLGRYDRALQPFFDLFPSEQIRVCFYEELFADVAQTAAGIYRFLGVDPAFTPPSLKVRFNRATDAPPSFLRRQRGHVLAASGLPPLRWVKRLALRCGLKDIRHYAPSNDAGLKSERAAVALATRSAIEGMLAYDMRRLAQRLGRELPFDQERRGRP
jgi:hypothetical protein